MPGRRGGLLRIAAGSLGGQRQQQREYGVAGTRAVGQRAAVLARHLLRHRQAQAAAVGAAGDQGQEDLLGQGLGHAAAVVGDLHAQRQRVHLLADAHPVFGAGAQADVGRAGLDGVAHQVPDRLHQAVRIAAQRRQARVVVAPQAHRPAGFLLGQADHLFEHAMDVERLVRAGGRGREQLVDQVGQPLHFRADQIDQLARVGIAGAPPQQLRRALESGQRIAQFVRQALEGGRQRQRQCAAGILAREFVHRMRLEQDPAIGLAGQPDIGKARFAPQERQRHPAQPQRTVGRLQRRQRPAQAIAFGLQRHQRLVGQALLAHPQPARERLVAAHDAPVPVGAQHRGHQRIQVGVEGGGHCTNIVHSPSSSSATAAHHYLLVHRQMTQAHANVDWTAT